MGSAASPFIVDDAIVGLAQPLTEALNQLASGPRRACDLIEELGRREDFDLDLDRTSPALFSCMSGHKIGMATITPDGYARDALFRVNKDAASGLGQPDRRAGRARVRH